MLTASITLQDGDFDDRKIKEGKSVTVFGVLETPLTESVPCELKVTPEKFHSRNQNGCSFEGSCMGKKVICHFWPGDPEMPSWIGLMP